MAKPNKKGKKRAGAIFTRLPDYLYEYISADAEISRRAIGAQVAAILDKYRNLRLEQKIERV